ncbi:MAG TPA: thioredoxin domain-containing protein [Nocardioidaceae bacterium]|nr:thioredoxin domain-containing protein [Nocardioidaceae bacterium]
MPNRLGSATSPYLLQHKDNPVDWREWSDEAFSEARARDVPVLLSVGYAACHWCHVMAHESFEDEATAAYLNEHFVAIKVDREERPDVDAVYMQATTAMTGQGGWPMTVALTPDREPFFAGTYFPDRPRQGQPAFRQVLEALVKAWDDQREQVAGVAAKLVAHLRGQQPAAGGPGVAGHLALDAAVLDGAVDSLAREYDAQSAGFGTAPKFPPSMVLEFLLRHDARVSTGSNDGGQTDAGQMVDATCEAMARGGIYDQLGGGFARYSVDRDWVVPHFEKMLYDNAQLLGVYLRWWRQTGNPLGERVARETAEFLLRELATEQGGFASSLDADSEGVEGKFYVWTPDELASALGIQDGGWAATLLQVTPAGTFEHGSSTLQLPVDPEDADRWDDVRRRLLEVRGERVRPGRDDKVVAAWNGLAIASLAEAGCQLREPRYVQAAERAGRLLADVHLDGRTLRRVSRDGVAGAPAGVLEDYGCVAGGFLALLSATGDPSWLRRAEALLDVALESFAADDGGFYDTPEGASVLPTRPRDPGDNASPSGQSALVHALLGYAALTGTGRHREAAEAALASVAPLAERVPRFAGWWLAAAEAALAGPLEVAIVGEPGDPGRDELERIARQAVSPGAVVVVGAPDTHGVPLLEGRGLLGGAPTAYVCRGMVCDRPVSTPEELESQLG